MPISDKRRKTSSGKRKKMPPFNGGDYICSVRTEVKTTKLIGTALKNDPLMFLANAAHKLKSHCGELNSDDISSVIRSMKQKEIPLSPEDYVLETGIKIHEILKFEDGYMLVKFSENGTFFHITTKIGNLLIGKDTIFPLKIKTVSEGGTSWVVRFHEKANYFRVPEKIAGELITYRTSYSYQPFKMGLDFDGKKVDISRIPGFDEIYMTYYENGISTMKEISPCQLKEIQEKNRKNKKNPGMYKRKRNTIEENHSSKKPKRGKLRIFYYDSKNDNKTIRIERFQKRLMDLAEILPKKKWNTGLTKSIIIRFFEHLVNSLTSSDSEKISICISDRNHYEGRCMSCSEFKNKLLGLVEILTGISNVVPKLELSATEIVEFLDLIFTNN